MTALETVINGLSIIMLSPLWDWMDWMCAENLTLNWKSVTESEGLNGCAGVLARSLLPRCVHAHIHTHWSNSHVCLNTLKRKWTVTHSYNQICKLPKASIELMSLNSLSFYFHFVHLPVTSYEVIVSALFFPCALSWCHILWFSCFFFLQWSGEWPGVPDEQ